MSNEWINCDVKMPEEHDSCFAKVEDRRVWRKESDKVLVTGIFSSSKKIGDSYYKESYYVCTFICQTKDGAWSRCMIPYFKDLVKITAWKNL